MSAPFVNTSETRYIESKYETVLGVHSYSLVKSLISNILQNNGYEVSYGDFVFKVVRSLWNEETENTKFGIVDSEGVLDEEETKVIALEMQKERVNRECVFEYGGQMIPRIVSVQYAFDYTNPPTSGNMYSPVSPHFGQRGMVINLETKEVLCPGMSWISVVDDLDTFDEIYKDVMHRPYLQIPVEGANVNIFRDNADGKLYIGTGHNVMTFEKILYGGGSVWNFYGKDFGSSSGGVIRFEHSKRNFDIHLAALECVANVALEYLVSLGRTDISSNQTNATEFVTKIVNEAIFDKNPNLVINGILTGMSFAGRSKTLSEEDLEFVTFTPTAYLERSFSSEHGKTIWDQEGDERLDLWSSLDRMFSKFSLDINKFSFDRGMIPSDYYVVNKRDNVWSTLTNDDFLDLISDKEDLLLIQFVRENGSRGMFRYKTPQTEFRDDVLRGVGAELEEIKRFFPKCRSRNYATPNTIRERVHQIITLTIAGQNRYTFQTIDVLGSRGSKDLGDQIKMALSQILSEEMNRHWSDIAFPISDFYIETQDLERTSVPRKLSSPVNRAVCNSIAVLYACASEVLRPVIVKTIAQFFASRASIAALSFLPEHAYKKIESRFMESVRETFPSDRLHAGVHKLRQLRENSSKTPNNASRKYKIAGLLSKKTALDIMFMSAVVNK